jgi:tRNA modification GTPase
MSDMIQLKDETIAAVSTPPGEGGISVIRISGARAYDVIKTVFQPRYGNSHLKNRNARYGWIKNGAESVDDVVVIYFKNPNSYTGEDVVEINCHGNPYICNQILNLLFRHGARPAYPGEFTFRAFLNGKMDLAQAEAVADLIHVKTEESRKAASNQLNGGLSNRIKEIRENLIHLCSLLEIELDFTEDDIGFTSKEEVFHLLQNIQKSIEMLLMSYDRGKICKEGIRIVIAGKPNVGKSSLLNCLLEKERAIVTELPGTTRDTVEDILDIAGFLACITDTAGVRQTLDPIEKEGILRTENAIANADLVLLVLDISHPITQEDSFLLTSVNRLKKKTFIVVNKMDLPACWKSDEITPAHPKDSIFYISALKKIGIQDLTQALESNIVSGRAKGNEETLLTSARHRQCVIKANEDIKMAERAIIEKMSQEFIAMDIRGAIDHLGEILGLAVEEEIINNIFSKFCVGK